MHLHLFPFLVMFPFVNAEVSAQIELVPCEPSGIQYNEYCVWSRTKPTGLTEALKECNEHSGNLFEFGSFEELDTARDYLNIASTTELFVGVKRIPNGAKIIEFKYFWLNGSGQATNERFFAPTTDVNGYDKDDVDCVSVTGSTFTAVDCNSKISFICQYKCVVLGANKCLDFKSMLDHVLIRSNLPQITEVPLTSTLQTKVVTPQDILTEILDHDNLHDASPREVTDYITGVHDAVVNSNDSVSTDVALGALIKLADVPTVTEDDFVLYAESMSRVLTMPSSDWSRIQDKTSDILVAMEHMICAAIIEEMDEIMEGFNIKVKTIQNTTGLIDVKVGFSDLEEIFLNLDTFENAGKVSTILYSDLDTRIPSIFKDGGHTDISSRVISVSVQSKNGSQTIRQNVNQSSAVNFTLIYFAVQNENKLKSKRICSYWDVIKSMWSGEGCHLVSQNESHTSCSCDHLTSFAVLVRYYDDERIQVSNVNDKALHIVSSVGCSFSILGMSMTIFVYIYLKILGKERIFIHTNLCISLLSGQLVFVITNEIHEDQGICKLVAILLHFFFLSAFTWMLVEGLSLYVTCTCGIGNHSNNKVRYLLIGWGLPIVIVLISFGSEFQNYGDGPGDSCWLSLKHGLIWAFMGPMLLIVFFNLIILGLILKVFLTLKTNKQKTEAARVRASLRAMVMLLPLLGMTWILSLLVPVSIWFRYMFVIGNSLQGMLIFFLHCLCNDEVRSSVAKRRASGFRTTDTDLSIVGRRKSLPEILDEIRTRHFPRDDMHGYRSYDADVSNGGTSASDGAADEKISVHF